MKELHVRDTVHYESPQEWIRVLTTFSQSLSNNNTLLELKISPPRFLLSHHAVHMAFSTELVKDKIEASCV